MNPIKIRILNEISDSYFYMGKLFVLTVERQLKFIDNNKLFKRYLQNGNLLVNHWLEKVLFGNDSLPTINDFKLGSENAVNLESFWNKMRDKTFEFKIEDKDLTLVCNLPENEPLDFLIYAEKAYVANRDGLFECQLSVSGESVLANPKEFQRVFDSKSINLNPRAGKVLVSTKSDGLFIGSINSRTQKTQISENQFSKSSLRTGWANYNFVNYDSSTEGEFFENETEEQGTEGFNFSLDDGSNSNRKITEIGTEQISLSEMFSNRAGAEKIIFSFNSLNQSFNVSETGRIHMNSFMNTNQYMTLGNLAFDLVELGYPLSGYTVSGGTVYEFFDKVILVKHGSMQILSDIECKQVRTFASSKWYQNIVMTLSDDLLEIHSIHP